MVSLSINSQNLKILNLKGFLSLKILEIEGFQFNVKEIIKFTANKLGGVHYDKVNKLDEINLKTSLDKLEKLRTPAMAIAINSISNIVLDALKPLKSHLLELPPNTLFLAHYDLENKGSLFFSGKNWMSTDKLNGEIGNGFGWFAELRLSHQRYKGRRFLYIIGSQEKHGFKLSTFITAKAGLGCKVVLYDKISIEIISEDFPQSNLFNAFFTYSSVLKISCYSSTLELYFNSILVGSKSVEHKKINTNFERHVIGGDYKGNRNALFDLKEMILLKNGLIDENIFLVNKYFERKYRK